MIKENNQQVPILDSLRAVAALSVCLFHFITGPVNFVTNESVLHTFHYGAYGVQLFFVISGFIIPWSISNYHYEIKNYFKFLFKRFLRLEPPYIASILLALLLLFVRGFFTDVPDPRAISINQVLLHIGYLIPFTDYKWVLDVYWTLAIEFQFYLFMGLFYFVIVSGKPLVRIIAYICVLSLAFVGTEKFLFYWLPVFLLGNLLFLFLTNRIKKLEFYSFGGIVFVFIFLFLPAPTLYSCLLAVGSILFLFNLSIPILNWIGKISYSIYLTHAIIGTTIINMLIHHANNTATKIGLVIVGLGVSILFSYVMYLVVEKPSKRLSSKIKFDRQIK